MIEPRIIVALANSLWQSIILVSFVAASLGLLGRTSANRRYAVWVATLAVCVSLPAIDFRVAHTSVEPVPSTVTPTIARAADAPLLFNGMQKRVRSQAEYELSAPVSRRPALTGRPVPTASTLRTGIEERLAIFTAAVARLASQTGSFMFWLWIGIANLFIVRLIVQLVALARVKRHVRLLESYDWIGQRPGIRRPYCVGVSDDVDVPCLLGLSKPVIAIPRPISRELSTNDLRRIVQHEAAHVRRYDDWFNLAEQLVLALLFFNPAIYYVTRAIHLEREIACDDQVVASEERLFYAECLSALAGRTRTQSTSFMPTFFRGRQDLIVRIEQLLDRRHVTHSGLGATPYVLGILTTILAIVLASTGIPVFAAPTPASPTASPAARVQQPVPVVTATATPHPITTANAHAPTTVKVIEIRTTTSTSTSKKSSAGHSAGTQKVKKVYIVKERSDCRTIVTTRVLPSESATAIVLEHEVSGTPETSSTVVTPLSTCPRSSHTGSKAEQIRVEESKNIIIVCPHGQPHIAHSFPPTDADIKALKAAGCRVTQPIVIEKVQLDHQMAALRHEMGAIWKQQHYDMQMYQAMKALNESQHALKMPPMPHMPPISLMMPFAKYNMQMNQAMKALIESQHALKMPHMPPMPRMELMVPFAKIEALDMADMALGVPPLPVKEISDMRQHGVTASYIASLSRLGYAGLPAADYIRLHDHHVTPESIEALRRAHPDESLSVDDLIRLQQTPQRGN